MRKIMNKKENMKKRQIWGKYWTKKRIWKNQIGKSWTKKRRWKKRKILNQKKNMRKANMKKVLEQKNKIVNGYMKKKCLNKVGMFCQQIRQGSYFICTVFYWCFLSAVSNYLNMKNMFLLQNCLICWDHLMKKIVYVLHFTNTFSRNEILYQAIFNKMSLDPIPNDLKDLQKLEKLLISKRIRYKKIMQ